MESLYFSELTPQLESETFNRLLGSVPNEKRLKISRYRFDIDKKLSLYSEILLRSLISRNLNIKNNNIKLDKDGLGKPHLKSHPDFHFNISHTKNAITVAVSTAPIGVDIEKVTAADIRIARRFFTADELNWVTSDKSELNKRFFIIWTKKEAALKRKGTGLTDIKNIDVTADNISDCLSTLRIDDYIISVCSKNKFSEDNLIRLDEADIIALHEFCLAQ